uniref:At2g35280-like TPR domain-containing protein n=2 Tax=Setaria italica TaxID=4555 RepID=K3XRU9_SETIT
MVVLTRSMAARRASLAHALPHDMAVEIAGCVAATSPRPVDDLRSLRASCRAMRAACSDRAVGRRVALEREAGAMRWSDHERYLAVVGSLSGAGNPEACFLSGIALVFAHRCEGAGVQLLAQAAAAGHKVAGYVLAVLLYSKDDGATAGDVARRHIREVEEEEAADGSGDVVGGCAKTAKKRSNNECVRCRGHAVEAVRQATWNMADLPAPAVVMVQPKDDGYRCTAKGCGVPDAWCDSAVFCSEDCRIRHERMMFFSQLPLTVANFVT